MDYDAEPNTTKYDPLDKSSELRSISPFSEAFSEGLDLANTCWVAAKSEHRLPADSDPSRD